MAQPHPEPPDLPPVIDPRADMERSREQARRESAMRHVSETRSNIEGLILWTERSRKEVLEIGDDPNIALALGEAVEQLQAVRKRLFQSTYFGGDQQRMF